MRRAFAVILALSFVPAAAADAQTKKSKPKPRRADLTATFVRSPPVSAASGTSFASSIVVRNRGKRTAPSSNARFYLSRDGKVSRGDMRVGGVSVVRLRATRRSTRRTQLRIPSFAPAGAYRVIGCANRPIRFKESSQRNNCRVARRAVRVVRIGAGSAPPPASIPGGLSISPATQSFGSAGVGARSGAVVFTVTNTSSRSSGTLGTSMVGAAAAQFAPTADTCAGNSLSGGGTCSITVVFGPTSTGDKAALLQVSGAPGGTVASQLTGIGITPAALAISSSSHQFGTVSSGANAEHVFTITNNGQATSGAMSTALSGADASQYSITADTCKNQTIAGGATCTVTVRFAPNSVGAKSATLHVSATPGGSVSSTLSGTGTFLSITPTSHNFPSTGVGSASTTQVFTVRNVGSAPQVLTTVTVPAHFSQSANTCAGTLAPDATCQVTVAFAPSSTGAKTGSLQVSSATGGTAVATLTGTGLTPATLSMSPVSHNFGLVVVGQMTPEVQFTVTNIGQVTSSALSSPTLTGADLAEFDIVAGANSCTGVTLAPNATCIARVRFSPASPAGAGPQSAGVQVTATQGGTASAALSGEGTNLSITPTTSGTLTPSGSQTFTVTNNGSTPPNPLAASLGGGDAAHFSITSNSCNVALAGGASCTVTVTFTPQAGTSGSRVAVLNVAGPDPGYRTQATVLGSS